MTGENDKGGRQAEPMQTETEEQGADDEIVFQAGVHWFVKKLKS